MAGGNTAADNITLNLGSGGANIATDYLSSEAAHAQFVKLGIGGDGSLNQITATNPLPVQTYALNPTWSTIPVGGGTGGQGITVNAEITVGSVDFVAGVTIDAVVSGITADIRSVGEGLTFGVANAGSSLEVVGSVKVTEVVTPSGFTTGTISVHAATSPVTLPDFTCSSGVKIKNFFGGGNADVRVSLTGGTPDDSNSYLMAVSEELFVEVDNLNKIRFGTASTDGATITYIGS